MTKAKSKDASADAAAETSFAEQMQQLLVGGGTAAIERQHAKGRGTARERIAQLLDAGSPWLEIGLWAAFEMYRDWGGAPAAGVVCGVGLIKGRRHMVIANDATVKAGAFFPMTAKKVLRAQKIAFLNRLPLVYLVDSAGVFLPLQEDVFPDEDDFGRIFRNNAVISAAGISQYAAILGNCVAGGGYLPVLCDKLLMTEGSGLYLAGPALVKSAIGQEVSSEDLGGALMHAAVSGTIDYREKDEASCLERLRGLVGLLPADPAVPPPPFSRSEARQPSSAVAALEAFARGERKGSTDVRDLLAAFVDAGSFEEYKADYGQTLVCGTARIGGFPVGIVANQLHRIKTARGEFQFGGVVYVDSADKAARFVMSCNQDQIPLLFLQDVNGFMVGRDSERDGIIKAGAKLVSAVSNSRVPKLTLITGGSFGAGNYALCGKAFDPRFIFAWPHARCAVMGAQQATNTLLDVMVASMKKQGHTADADELAQLREQVAGDYERQTDVRYAAARLWVDAIIEPAETRNTLIQSLEIVTRQAVEEPYRLGVFQV
ncbi:acyl-CoA carboxylase subunit beta [Anatilimnocola floriformis]|uniref:acyl-CoA carboxylase subunit beta n=1 Tax=Anatilimnocola floriformis TaxID=2948575 RepID=UPI0020C3C1D5|nr:acyl-CoA carboxylase subunit beta [Anatilimnocola floriformis]